LAPICHADQIAEIVLLDRDPRPAHDRVDPSPLELGKDLAHAPPLHDHAADANDIGTGAATKVDRLDVLVD
jgi:hypothetical protein